MKNTSHKELTAWYRRLDIHLKEIILGSTSAFFFRGLGALCNFLLSVLIGRLLKADGAGMFFLALTFMLVASVVSRVGLDNTVLRFAATQSSAGDWSAVKGLYRQSMLVVFFSSSLVTLGIWLLAPWLAHWVFSNAALAKPLRWMGLAVVPHAILWLQAEFLKGIKRIAFSQLVQSTSFPAMALLMIGILRDQVSVQEVVLVYTFALLLTALLGYRLWKRSIPDWHSLQGAFANHDILHHSFPLYIVALMQVVMAWASTIFLGVWASSAEVGIFSVAQRTALLVSFVLAGVNSIAAPKFAALYGQQDTEALGRTVLHVSRLMVLGAVPVLLLFVIKSGWIMGLFGADFKGGSTILTILALGQFVNVITGSVSYLLMMSGHGRLLRNNVVFCASLNLCLCLILIPSYGALGAAIVTATTLSVMNLISVYFVRTRLRISTISIWPLRVST